MGSEKAGLLVLLLCLEGLVVARAARHHLRAHPLPGVETPRKTLAADYVFSACDFDSTDHPFCNWTQPQDSHGSLWLRDLGGKPGQSPGPPEGDIARREYYIHPGAGGSAQLESPDLDPAGAEVCVRFLYYLYTFHTESQLAVEIRDASGTASSLWIRGGLQSSSWLSGAVTVPAQAQRPFKVVFKATQVMEQDVGLAVDSIFIQLGPCSPCVTKCDFDVMDELCGWENQLDADVVWEQQPGSGIMPDVGPEDDFSRPGFGSYMLLNSFNEGARGTAFLKSPTFNSSGGCLFLSFYYTLHGVANNTALKVYAAAPGGELGVPLLTLRGEHGPHWRPGAANYTGRESIQFVFEGTFAGEPGLAVDSVAVSPCEEIFAACDFNNNADPFCGWSEPVANSVAWIRTNQSTPTEETGPPGDYPQGEGYYIFAEAGFLKPGESMRLSSRPFCMNQEACVEFYYHMQSFVPVETQLRVLLEEPSGRATLLWSQTGPQGPNWLFGSVTVPYGGAQPSRVTFEVVRGSNAFLDVALDNILVHRHRCAVPTATPVPPSVSSTASSTAGGPVVTVPPERPTISQPTTVTSSSPTTSSAPTTPKATVTKPRSTTLSSTADSAHSTRPVATTTTTPHSSANLGQGSQTTTGLPSSSQAPSCATPTSTQSSSSTATLPTPSCTPPTSTPGAPPQPPSTGQTSPAAPVTAFSVSAIASVGSTSQGTTVPTRNETLATSTVSPSSSITTTSGGDLGPTPPSSTSSTSTPGHSGSTSTSHVRSTGPSARPPTDISSSVQPSSPTTATLPNITIPTRTASAPKLTTTLQTTTGSPSTSKITTPLCILTPSASSQSPQPSGPSTTVPLPTDDAGTPKPTSKRPGIDQTTSGQPPDRVLCTVSGDPHYTTYDGHLFHFMGNCTYLLTAACNATPGQPTFQVQTTNEHRGSNTQISYLKSVSIAVHGTQIVLLKGRRVTVDGKRVTLPVSLAGGQVSVRLSGTYVLVQTDFGLLVRFDGNHHAEVSAPSSYVGKLCGLCGNYNGQASDDNLMPNGTSAGADADRLGESWQVPNVGDPSCTNSGNPGECNPDIAAEAQGPTGCGILTDPQGPFAPCHGKVPPEGAFESCFYDLCGTGGDTGSLCFALQSYADRCAQAGVTITWRNSTFCPLHCPLGSSYTPCGPACPATCTDPESQNGCPDLPCVEGCMCNQSFVLSGDQCVPLSQCGCTDSNGHYHVVGDSWMGNLDCTQRCSCAAGNQITCEEWSCTPVQECRPVEGLLGCQDTGVATCHVAGDPHYFTFDGKMVSFMGTCTYTLVAVCQHHPRLPAFNITAKNEERGQPEASYLRLVTVQMEGVTITLQKGRRVLIDGQRVRTPVEGRIPGLSITSRGIYVVLETKFGLVVKFDGNHHLEIQLPGTYFGKVCGMCGNFNNQSIDDYLMPNGHLAVNDTQFGNSWKAPGDADPGCQPDDRLDLHPNCSRQELERLEVLCREIMAPKYQPCHSVIDPKLFFQNCLYDMCEYQGMTSVLCDNIQAYVEACSSQGVTSISWRNSTFCPLPCPPNSHYTECASPCPATCPNLYAPANCHHPTPCVEGCACDRGYVLSDDVCVPMRECGCLDSQQEYHNSGDIWVTSDCLQQCTCLDGGQIQCQPFHCLPGSQCSISTEGLHYCRPTTFHQCVISGDPHYRTFDNFVHHFQGRCTYALTRTLGRVPEALEPLSVAGRNYRRSPLQRFSFLREVYVEVLGYRITLMQGRKMAVNGVMVTPPYYPRDGLQITQRGRSLFVQTNFGFSVSFDGKNSAEIVLPGTYQQRVGGLCGNYDGRRNNEYMKPDGTLTRLLNTFGNSWQVSVQRKALDGGSGSLSPARVRRQEPAEEPESGFEIDCTPEQLTFVNGTTVCGALSAPAGPFSACHRVVPPAPFQESCIYDMCALFNDTELLCQDFEAYAQLCQEGGVDLGLWRQKTGCTIGCPAHTSYQPCMSACPASCANLAAPSNCEAPCIEGCASDPGYVLSGLLSVPYSQCGCFSSGQYYQINETFMTEDCSQQCTCQFTEILECLPAGCDQGKICAVDNYRRNCFEDSPCLSSPCQNEGTCQNTPEGFLCLCIEGYIGLFCEEAPLDGSSSPPPFTGTPSTILSDATLTTKSGNTEDPNLLYILLGVFISLAVVLLLVLTIVCVCRQRKGKKMEEDYMAILSAPGSVEASHPSSSRITPL